MKKKLYLVQASAVYGESVKTAYLPYAAGCLSAYAFADVFVRDNYELPEYFFMREDIERAVDSLSDPFLVGFSSYIWNMEYNKAFARAVKARYPDCKILFGGHNMAPDGSDLNEISECDYIIHGEGEVPFRKLLLYLCGCCALGNVPNLSYRGADGEIITTEKMLPPDVSDFPSPYLSGCFDGIIKESGIAPSVVWETNRGCPNHCAFCDWGELKSRVRRFPEERIKAEIDWMVKNKVEYVYCADANFGLFPRDRQIADMIISSNHTFGYPKVFKTNYTKNNDDAVFEISSKLIENKIGKSPTLSFQSLSPEVLANIGRSNMELEHFRYLMAKYSEAKIPVYSELILGLPGETYDSFVDGVCSLIECNQHTSIGIYPCELLPNSALGSRESIKKFKIGTVHTAFSQYHIVPGNGGVSEKSNIIIKTESMSEADWLRAFIFSVCVQTFHNLALTRTFAIYLNKEQGVSYREFYEGLIEWLGSCDENTVCGKAFKRIYELSCGVLDGKNSFSCVWGDSERLTWTFEEFMFIFLARSKKEFYAEITDYLRGFNIDGDIFRQLLLYQSEVIKTPGREHFSLELDYDFYGYFRRIYTDCYAPLEKRKNIISTDEKAHPTWDEASRFYVWYGRRDDAQLYTGMRNTVEQNFT